jgi:hypothetical protein
MMCSDLTVYGLIFEAIHFLILIDWGVGFTPARTSANHKCVPWCVLLSTGMAARLESNLQCLCLKPSILQKPRKTAIPWEDFFLKLLSEHVGQYQYLG